MSNPFDSPFIVPVAGCLMILGLGASGIYSEMRGKELRSQERIAMLNRGIPLSEIKRVMSIVNEQEKRTRDPLRSLHVARRTAIVLLSVGLGLAIFGALLAIIIQQREVLVVSAVGVVNLAIGAGFLIDYSMQKRELAHFGMELETDLTLSNASR